MKHTIVALIVAFGLIVGSVASADEKRAEIAKHNEHALKIDPTKLLDPKDLADDICWVAPEWREE